MIYNYTDIKTIHLEITEKCNASCLQCLRNINGGEENPYLKQRELSLKDIQKIIPPSLCKQLNHIYMCGNYGDPIIAQDTLEVFKYFRDNNSELLLGMNTNGSARNTSWWINLANIIKNNGYVIFSIDGLEDTNQLYRQNTVWSKIIENCKAFINAGGVANWEFIVFGHNEHQIDDAKKLSIELGFKKFTIKKSSRFLSLTGTVKENSIIKDKKGNIKNISIPKDSKLLNQSLSNFKKINDVVLPTSYEEIKNKTNPQLFLKTEIQKKYDNAVIDCKVKKDKSLFISAEGIVQPCCWIAGQMYPWHHSYKSTQIWKLINKISIDKINALSYSIEYILNTDYFQNMISDSWMKPSCQEGKLYICSKTCGENVEGFTKQYE